MPRIYTHRATSKTGKTDSPQENRLSLAEWLPGPAGDRGRWLAWGRMRDCFESDTGLDPLIGAHRELLRLYEPLQFCVGR
jgi:hypothetical protein